MPATVVIVPIVPVLIEVGGNEIATGGFVSEDGDGDGGGDTGRIEGGNEIATGGFVSEDGDGDGGGDTGRI